MQSFRSCILRGYRLHVSYVPDLKCKISTKLGWFETGQSDTNVGWRDQISAVVSTVQICNKLTQIVSKSYDMISWYIMTWCNLSYSVQGCSRCVRQDRMVDIWNSPGAPAEKLDPERIHWPTAPCTNLSNSRWISLTSTWICLDLLGSAWCGAWSLWCIWMYLVSYWCLLMRNE